MQRSALNSLKPAVVASARARDPATAAPEARLPRVCFVAPLAWPVLSGDTSITVVGGAEVQQCHLSRAFAAAGYETSMICLDYGQPDDAQVDRVRVIKAYRPKPGVPVLRFIHPRFSLIWRAMRRADADIYYVRSGSVLAGYAAAFCRLYRRRFIYAGATDNDFIVGREMMQYRRDRKIYQWGVRHADAVIAQNPVQVSNFRKYYGGEPLLVYSAYRAPAGSGCDPEGPIAWVATVREYKRPERLLEVARMLPHRRFIMIGGPGSDTPEALGFYDRIACEARSLPNVEFAGFLPLAQVEKRFNGVSIFVNTSENEGFPNTFLQAWARGIPTIGMLDTGFRVDGQHVYPVVSTSSEMAAQIERLLGDRQNWEAASRRCLEYFTEHHSLEAVTGQYAQIFRELMRKPDARGER